LQAFALRADVTRSGTTVFENATKRDQTGPEPDLYGQKPYCQDGTQRSQKPNIHGQFQAFMPEIARRI
jgi:hypothetical protein